MPAFDGTGPTGAGPMTGRGMGPCANLSQARGWGRGRRGFGGYGGYGRGLGRCFGWNAPRTKEEEIEDIKAYKKALKEELEDVDKELADLQK